MKGLGKGDKPGTNSDVDAGLSERSSFDSNMKLRGETGEGTQRPTATTKTVKTDRGSFTDKC